jgi:hypothetical protein
MATPVRLCHTVGACHAVDRSESPEISGSADAVAMPKLGSERQFRSRD